jgi:hypothetical protein
VADVRAVAVSIDGRPPEVWPTRYAEMARVIRALFAEMDRGHRGELTLAYNGTSISVGHAQRWGAGALTQGRFGVNIDQEAA